jgi:hypothetical protein
MFWNIIPTKFYISRAIHYPTLDTSCFLCSFSSDSLSYIFFNCLIARVVWGQSFWPLDTTALHMTNMID